MNAVGIRAFEYVDWERLRGKTVFLTGVTGLLGFTVFKLLNQAEAELELDITLICLVRDRNKAVGRLSSAGMVRLKLVYMEGSVTDRMQSISVDYVIHCAADTASRSFLDSPAKVMRTSIEGTINVLEFARESKASGMIYLSSMEVYGRAEKGNVLTEQMVGTFDPANTRDCYPIGKIACEELCHSYMEEYGFPVKVARLSQVIGEEYSENDVRFPALMIRCAKEKKDIVLKTRGLSERCYISSLDAAGAILLILLKGTAGDIYNVADEESYCSVSELAERIAAENGIKVVYDIAPPSESGFPPDSYLHLDTQKLRSLGWKRVAGIRYRY